MKGKKGTSVAADEREFSSLVGKITAATHALRQDALGVVNRSVTARAWLIGYYIVEFEQGGKVRAAYGDGLLKRLSERLGGNEYSVHTLKKYREFYRIFPRLACPIRDYLVERFGKGYSANIQLSVVGETISNVQTSKAFQIGYSANTQSSSLLEFDDKGENVSISPNALFSCLSYTHMSNLLSLPIDLMRTFYAFEAIRGTWSVKELKRQIESQYYQRCGWSKDPHKYAAMVQGKVEKLAADDFIKSSNVLEFLGAKLPPDWEEGDLEQGICDNLKDFILEMGAGFCFEARQKKILIDDAYEKIDLVFYHRILKCHVLIELKPKKFSRADAVQLGVYMEYYRKRVMTAGDNPPIGILMCTEIGKELAEYIAPFIDERLFLTKYMLQLPSKETLTGFLKKENEGLNA